MLILFGCVNFFLPSLDFFIGVCCRCALSNYWTPLTAQPCRAANCEWIDACGGHFVAIVYIFSSDMVAITRPYHAYGPTATFYRFHLMHTSTERPFLSMWNCWTSASQRFAQAKRPIISSNLALILWYREYLIIWRRADCVCGGSLGFSIFGKLNYSYFFSTWTVLVTKLF